MHRSIKRHDIHLADDNNDNALSLQCMITIFWAMPSEQSELSESQIDKLCI